MSELTESATTQGATPAGERSYGEHTYSQSGPAVATTDRNAKEKATEAAQAGKQAAGEVAQTAADKAKDVAEETKTQARNVAMEAKDQLLHHTGEQHRNLVNNLRSLGDELGSMAERGDEQSGMATDVVAKASKRAHSAASWLDAREPGQLVDELRSFAARRPAAFLVGAVAAGVLAGRLTRGVKAVHTDDSGSAPAHQAMSANVATPAPMPATPAGERGYVAGNGTVADGAVYHSEPVHDIAERPAGERW